MAQRTLSENVAQAKADFGTIAEVIQENDILPLDTPTSEYAGMLKNIITKSFDDGVQAEIDLSKYIEKSASGKVIRLDDVSEVYHNIKVYADTPTEVKVYGKNLFNNDTSLLKEVTYTNLSGTVNTKTGYEYELPVGTYTFTLTDLDTSISKYVYWIICDKDYDVLRSGMLLQVTSNATPQTITVNEGEKVVIYDGYSPKGQTAADVFNAVQIQLEAGSVATPYEEYKEPQTITATPEGTEIPSLCPTMTFIADNDVAVDYFGSYGMQTEYDRFWDAFLQNGNRTYFVYGFCGAGWNNASFKPKYDLTPSTADHMFYASEITDLEDILESLGVTLDTSNTSAANYIFGNCKITKVPIVDFSNATATQASFQQGSIIALQSIRGIICSEKTVFHNTAFNKCSELTHCIFEGIIANNINLQWSTKLDVESLVSLFNCLKVFSGTAEAHTKTITLSAESWALLGNWLYENGYEDFVNAQDVIGNYLGWNVA